MYIGETLAFFQSPGNTPVDREQLKIIVNEGAITLAESFMSLADILSGLDAFEHFMSNKSLKTSSKEISLNLNMLVAGVTQFAKSVSPDAKSCERLGPTFTKYVLRVSAISEYVDTVSPQPPD